MPDPTADVRHNHRRPYSVKVEKAQAHAFAAVVWERGPRGSGVKLRLNGAGNRAQVALGGNVYMDLADGPN